MKSMARRTDREVTACAWVWRGRALAWAGLLVGLMLAGDGRVSADGPDTGVDPLARRGQTTQDLRHIWNFDGDGTGETPTGFLASTLGEGPAGHWKVEVDPQAPSPPNRLVQDASCSATGCLQVLLLEGTTYDYPDVTVRLRMVGERTPGVGGIVFAAQDARNFYAALVDLAAESLEVIRVVNGEIRVVGRETAKRKPSAWHFLRAQHNTNLSKDYIEVSFDGKVVFSTWDTNLNAGRIGLATRGSASVAFDNLNAIQLFSQRPLSPPAAY